MDNMLPKKIDKVQIEITVNHPDEPYSDHEAEDILLKLFSNPESEAKRLEILANDPSWALYYHLSPRRNNLIRWYEFEKNARVLEVGAGCGAITEELVRRDAQIVALEMTRKRALINAHRNHEAKNLKMVVGNLDTYKQKKKFDYAIVVGVLEYAGTFYHSSSPYHDFLRAVQAVLSPGGKLLLAIENRFGLKYWAGAKEDHAHTFFEGHNGYPGQKRVQTFGKKELSELIKSAGFSETNFYYPFPDYKTPFFVYSDAYYPGNGTQFPLSKLPAPTYDREREHFFSEQCIMPFLEKNNLFPDFSNSFLVEATL